MTYTSESAKISRELHMLRLHYYRKRKKGGQTCKRSKLPNLAAPAAELGGGNRDTKTNGIKTLLQYTLTVH